jgi:hypothetical protein
MFFVPSPPNPVIAMRIIRATVDGWVPSRANAVAAAMKPVSTRYLAPIRSATVEATIVPTMAPTL